MAARGRRLGLGWDRSTVARVELGQRQVSAVELLLLSALHGCAVAELLPNERVRLSDSTSVSPKGLRTCLVEGRPAGWRFAGVRADALRAFDRLRPMAAQLDARFPGTDGLTVGLACEHASDEVTVKGSARLEVDPLALAVAAQHAWGAGLAAERDRRVDALGPATSARARQARRGHITRALLEEVRPILTSIMAKG